MIQTVSPMDLINAYQRSQTAQPVQGGFSEALSAAQRGSLSSGLDDIFQRAAERYQVPVELLRAIGKAESGFNPDAVSPAGAQGVMQLMPGTARGLGVTDSFDPEQNIMGGAKYISQMLQTYQGDVKLALAAYNAGSGNVKKYGGIPPFQETQAYISKVTGYMEDAGLRAPNDPMSGRLPAQIDTQLGESDFDELVKRWTSEMNMSMAAKLLEVSGSDDLFSTDLSDI